MGEAQVRLFCGYYHLLSAHGWTQTLTPYAGEVQSSCHPGLSQSQGKTTASIAEANRSQQNQLPGERHCHFPWRPPSAPSQALFHKHCPEARHQRGPYSPTLALLPIHLLPISTEFSCINAR